MDKIIYLISAAYVSTRSFRQLALQLEAAAPCRAEAIRLEGHGDGIWKALDKARAEGATRIELRPIGLPFSQSLEKWLPGAAGAWLARQQGVAPDLFLAAPLQTDAAATQMAARAQVALKPITSKLNGQIGRGWDRPPDFRHHLLVCADPRCHLLDAPSLLDSLKLEINRARVGPQCLITSTGCLFPCNNGPVLVHYPEGRWYQLGTVTEVQHFVQTVLKEGGTLPELQIH